MLEKDVSSLSRGLYIIEYIAYNQPVGFNQIKEHTAINNSSLNRLLKTLISNGYICKDAVGKYALSLKPFTIAYSNFRVQPLFGYSHNILLELSNKYSVSVAFVSFSISGYCFLDKVECPDNVALRSIGDFSEILHDTPWGFLKLYLMPENERYEYMKKVSPTLAEKIYQSFDFISSNGYADESWYTPNRRKLAIPIYDNNKNMIAAIAIGSHVDWLDDKKCDSILKDLTQMLRKYYL